jgi:hypothetical protein
MTRLLTVAACLSLVLPLRAADAPLRVAPFDADITCPLGTPLCDGLCPVAKEIVDLLKARGVVILGKDKPVVLCAMDWVGVGNSGYDAFRDALAQAAGTTRERVAVHCLHQHDAPGCDFEADDILKPYGLGGKLFDPAFARKAIDRVAAAVAKAVKQPRNVTHIGTGKAKVQQVASTRRVLGADGKVAHVRYTTERDAKWRAEPEGTIDPYVHLLSFWDGEKPIASLTYYATHPQTYYGAGGVSCDMPGLARGLRDKAAPDVLHVHFNGAGGNVTAGKYNDGNHANRMILASRLAQGMKEASEQQKKFPVTAADVEWRVQPVALPLSKLYNSQDLKMQVADKEIPANRRLQLARALVWARRCEAGEKIDLTCLHIGPAYVLNMPGELFVEYQLAAEKMRPDAPVLMAAYGDYGPGYIGTAIAYTQGGYEVGPVSRVAPAVEDVLMGGMRELLK